MKHRLALLTASLALWASPARAQFVDPTHPCYESMSFYLNMSVTDAIWANADALSSFAARIHQDLLDMLGKLDKLDKEIADAPPSRRAEMLAELKKLEDCVTWLETALLSLEQRLRVLGANTLTIDEAGERKRVQREEHFKSVRERVNKIRGSINAILARRRGPQ